MLRRREDRGHVDRVLRVLEFGRRRRRRRDLDEVWSLAFFAAGEVSMERVIEEMKMAYFELLRINCVPETQQQSHLDCDPF